ncbi:MAG: hypothetical protein PHP92_03750 [Candidatus Nanoarchaeia archaeon]|nr:hypothetical protein [Candidatus Nanoarchaeia archaeon]
MKKNFTLNEIKIIINHAMLDWEYSLNKPLNEKEQTVAFNIINNIKERFEQYNKFYPTCNQKQ